MRPSDIPLQFLEDITDGFSNNRILGSGGYGQVYKGVDKNGREIAVKKLYPIAGPEDLQFTNEFNSLMRVRHQNVVRLLGYCYKTRHKFFEHEGEFLLCKSIDRVICLEYLQSGSLDKHLNELSCGHDWPTCYKIIKGIIQGLSYLHQKAIFHLDLKPANILLDKNMVPKIADFGLSRLFSETRTYTTKNAIGTTPYMPPEYLTKRKISEKFDVFSLGLIIIDIMAGKGSYSNADMSSQEFIEHVYSNWRKRIESTPMYASPEKDCHQVKRCIELALRCVEFDRNNRPTVEDIIRELTHIETTGSASPRDQMQQYYLRLSKEIVQKIFEEPAKAINAIHSTWKKARLAKMGQWGGVGGGTCDIEVAVAPRVLKSLIIGSGEVIYSLEFSYEDHDGTQHTAGPWGAHGPKGHGRFRQKINFGPSELLTAVHGTIGPCDFAPAGVIKSLTIITTAAQYGPFGEVKGTPFEIPVQTSNGSIVGFLARAGWCVDAFGIYVKPKQESGELGLAKIGPWGGKGGQAHDVEAPPRRLESVTVCSGAAIVSLAFTYRGHDGQAHAAGPWGGPGGGGARADTIQLGNSEFLTGVHGTTGPVLVAASAQVAVVTSLTLVTNERTYGPFGECRGTPFDVPMWSKGSIVGFFGRADQSHVSAIGVCVNPDQEAMEEQLVSSHEPGLTKIGQWGGDGGEPRDIDTEIGPYRLESVTINCGAIIHSLSFSYIDFKGDQHTVGPWGTPAGKSYKIVLEPLELLQGISGTVGSSDGTSHNVITSLAFATNHCRGYGPFGQGGGTPFSAAAETDGCIVGFFGRAGSCLEALGVYVHRY